jgi:tellurite resistance protein TerC
MISLKTIKRVVILVVGSTVLALGVVLLVLPGPAFIVIPVGLAILAVEFAWARRWLHRVREMVQRARGSEVPDGGVQAPDPGAAAGRQ